MFSKTTEGQVLFIRHGETDYNKFLLENPSKETQLNQQFKDCSLSEKGKLQSLELSRKIKDLRIKYVFCSPLNRCLETTFNALKNHPQKEQIVVMVHPYISEIVHSFHDVSGSISSKKEIYNENSEVKFTWELFDSYFPENGNENVNINADTYFLNFIDNTIPEKLDLKDKFIINNVSIVTLLGYFIYKDERPESLTHLQKRTKYFLQFLNEFMINKKEELEKNGEKIVVVTHSAFIRLTTSLKGKMMKKIDTYPDDCYKPDNCEVISVNLTEEENKRASDNICICGNFSLEN
jgi:broad specificity phosphatase PhoE